MTGTTIRLRVRAAALPEPLRHCSHCGSRQSFATQGRFRLNAQGKRVDLWLIYRCRRCDATWNRAVVERMAVARYEKLLRQRVERDGGAFARELAFDTRSADGSRAPIEARMELRPPLAGPGTVEIELVDPIRVRLDRVVAGAFGLSRDVLAALVADGRVEADGGQRAFERPAVHGMHLRLRVDLRRVAGRKA